MKLGIGLIQVETKVILNEGCFLILTTGSDEFKYRVSCADLEVFEKSVEKQFSKKQERMK